MALNPWNPYAMYDTGGGTAFDNPRTTTTQPRPTGYGGSSGTGASNPYANQASLPRQVSPTGGVFPTTPPIVPSVPPGASADMVGGLNRSGASGNTALGAASAGFTTPTGFPQNGTAPMSGWAKNMGYTPFDIAGMNQMPARYLFDILQNRGMDPTGGLFYGMEPYADIMMPMFELMYGSNPMMAGGFDPNQIANFMGPMFEQLMTPGGRGFDMGELWANLIGGGQQGSPLFQGLQVGTPEEQIEAFRPYAMMLAQQTGSPLYQRAMSNLLSQQGYNYLDQFTGGNQPPAGTWFGSQVGNVGMGG